ncbi:unnamed protein product [Rotaria sordida]|uniref:Uncharacterized protein n=1 Tax=Rotaria sordida TaxID=392033 RepID=A0A815C552_9BILA|nr:unnamed protein product [Rotaria sordida]
MKNQLDVFLLITVSYEYNDIVFFSNFYIHTNIDDYDEMALSTGHTTDYIFTVFINLIHLTFYKSSYKNRIPLFFADPPSHTFRSSTFLKLNIRIYSFDDCLYFLDGHFNQLRTLYVDLIHIERSYNNQNKGDVPNLKCFHLSCNYETFYYDELILSLLYRMSNLEELEEFLFDTKIHFQNIFLRIKCESLQRVTQNFTRDATRINCVKINKLELSGEPLYSDSLQQYFPHARISYNLVI